MSLVVETSALVCIVQEEPESAVMAEAIRASSDPLISAANLYEAQIVLAGRQVRSVERKLAALLAELGVSVVPFDAEQARLAFQAFLTYGKGRHPAGLNFGDCFAYALAKARGAKLLYKGDDFARTDLA